MTDPVRPVAPREDEVRYDTPATEVLWPQDAPDLVEMAHEWPLPTDDSGAMFSGDVLIHKLGNALAQALAAAPVPCAASPADSWQPIETAPKDGTWFIGLVDANLGIYRRVSWGRNLNGDLCWCGTTATYHPTHWIPMPRAPAPTGEGARDGSDCVRRDIPARPDSGPADVPLPDGGSVAVGPPFDDWASHILDGYESKSPSQIEWEIVEALQKAWHLRADTPPVAVSLDPHRLPSAWSEFGDGHDYSRTGKHDPNACRFCLRAELARLRGEATVRPEKDDVKICTFCAKGQPAFQLQSGTGNLWHRNEAGQLYKCLAQIAKSATVRVEE
jgi:hypothetical protein